MQQLFAAFGVNWNLLIAQAVNFGVVLIALWYFLYQPVNRMLERRRDLVAKGVEDAKEAEAKLMGADAEATRKVKGAENEAEGIVSAAREAASVEKLRIVKDAEARANAALADAQAQAQETAARATRESEREITRLAMLAAEKIMQKNHD